MTGDKLNFFVQLLLFSKFCNQFEIRVITCATLKQFYFGSFANRHRLRTASRHPTGQKMVLFLWLDPNVCLSFCSFYSTQPFTRDSLNPLICQLVANVADISECKQELL